MANLKWNALECGWECSECGALYSTEEVARVFEFQGQVLTNFHESYCMDCGRKWTEAVIEINDDDVETMKRILDEHEENKNKELDKQE